MAMPVYGQVWIQQGNMAVCPNPPVVLKWQPLYQFVFRRGYNDLPRLMNPGFAADVLRTPATELDSKCMLVNSSPLSYYQSLATY